MISINLSPVSPVDTGQNGINAFSFVINAVRSIIKSWDNITFFHNFSLLDFFIAVLAMGLIITVVISTAPNFALNTVDFKQRSEDKAAREKAKKEYRDRSNKSKGK